MEGLLLALLLLLLPLAMLLVISLDFTLLPFGFIVDFFVELLVALFVGEEGGGLVVLSVLLLLPLLLDFEESCFSDLFLENYKELVIFC